MTRPLRHPRRPASRRPRRRSSIWKPGRVYLTVPRTAAQLELASKYLQAADTLSRSASTRRAGHARRLSERAGQGEGGRGSRARRLRAGDARRPPRPSAAAAGGAGGAAASARRDCRRPGRGQSSRRRPSIPSSGVGGCCTKRGNSSTWATTTWPSTRSTRPRRSTSSGGCSTTRRPRSPRKSRRHGPRRSRRRAPAASQPHDRRTATEQAARGADRAGQPPVRAGGSHRAGGQGMGTDLRPLRGQSGQGGGRGTCLRRRDKIRNTPPARAVEPGGLRHPGAGVAPAHRRSASSTRPRPRRGRPSG